MQKVRKYLLTYIGYCLKNDGKVFRYEKCLKAVNKTGIEAEITTLRKEFSEAKNEKLIDFKHYYSKNIPVLTQKGRLAAKTSLPFKSFGTFDGKLYLVIFGRKIVRKYREKLENDLLDLGFGQLEPNVFISPYSLFNLVVRRANTYAIRRDITLLEISNLIDQEKIGEVWHLDEINQNYKDFLKLAKTLEKQKNRFLWPILAKRLETDFSKIYTADPHLPEKLLPQNWLGKDAYKKFKEISNSY